MLLSEIAQLLRRPDAVIFSDATGSYFAGDLLTGEQLKKLRSTHQVIEVKFGDDSKEPSGNIFELLSPYKNGSQGATD